MGDAPRVKICGLTNAADMEHAVRAGADFLGVVFAPSPRQVEPDELAEWLPEARDLAEVVGVFVDSAFDAVVAAVERFDLDLVQLHGAEAGDQWARLPVRMIEARIVDAGALPPSRFRGVAWADLLDGGAGEGRRFDWTLVGDQTRSQRIFLAGGLTPDNVAEAARQVRPFAVDVSSGVEAAPGRKDPDKVTAFVRAAKGVA